MMARTDQPLRRAPIVDGGYFIRYVYVSGDFHQIIVYPEAAANPPEQGKDYSVRLDDFCESENCDFIGWHPDATALGVFRRRKA